jgi:hypothetical protein
VNVSFGPLTGILYRPVPTKLPLTAIELKLVSRLAEPMPAVRSRRLP